MTLIIDFETRSECNLKAHGAWRYSKHPSTEVLCMAYQFETGEPVHLWKPGDSFPSRLKKYILSGEEIEAHNYFFEQCIWDNIMFPIFQWLLVAEKNWRCSAARASRNNLPRSLDGACKALKLPVQKDKEGHRLMLKMCKPRKPTKNNDAKWHETPEDLARLYEYCRQDVLAERALSEALPPLEPFELAIWQFTNKLNQKGVYLDLDFAQRAVEMFEAMKRDAKGQVKALTAGAVNTTGQVGKIIKWAETQGVELPNLQKETVTEILTTDIPDHVKTVLRLRVELGRGASISKYKAMLDRADPKTCRLHDHVVCFGTDTSRWAARGVQTHNLPNKMDIDKARTFISQAKSLKRPAALRLAYKDPAQELSSCIRPTFRAAPGKELVCVDYSSIEARVLAWLTDDPNIDLLRAGKDIYCEMAERIYKRPITKADVLERKLGKEAELACGYQIWWPALLSRCWKKGVKVSSELTYKTVRLYRDSHPNITEFWREVNEAFLLSVMYSKTTTCRSLTFEPHGNNTLIHFPSGRYLVFNQTSVRSLPRRAAKSNKLRAALSQCGADKKTIDLACQSMDKETKSMSLKPSRQVCYWHVAQGKWLQSSLHGGKITGLACQKMAGDILSLSSLRLAESPERFGHTVLTVHDELVNEIDKGRGDLDAMIAEMCAPIDWAPGLPLAGEGWIGPDYRKG